jgi:hypothetical protein
VGGHPAWELDEGLTTPRRNEVTSYVTEYIASDAGYYVCGNEPLRFQKMRGIS